MGRSPADKAYTTTPKQMCPLRPALVHRLCASAKFCYHSLMIRIACLAVLSAGLASAEAITPDVPDKVPARGNYDEIQRQVETLRGKRFVHPVPVYRVSNKELRHIAQRELEKQFPGTQLH